YIAIVHPLKANILCNRRNTLIGIACIWPLSAAFAIPIPIFNVIGTPPNATDAKCATRFPGNHGSIFSAWKYAEMTLWYIVPMVILIVLYTIVGHRLFAGAEELHGGRKDKGESDALKARRGVIKMLVASVVLYLISYSPIQGMLIYTTFRPFPLHKRWMWHAFVISLVYVNSAANPILYSIFSQNFRRRFQRMVCFCSTKYRAARSLSTAGSSCSQTVGQCPSNATKYSLVHLNRGHSEA
ncbi:neuropeptide receptor 15-like, partial [Lingula anatina]